MAIIKKTDTTSPTTRYLEEAVNEIAEMARDWLLGEHRPHGDKSVTHQHIIENLLTEINRLETLNSAAQEEIKRIRAAGTHDIRRAAAEECAVICETADYLVRSYGCAREIRLKFGLPLKNPR